MKTTVINIIPRDYHGNPQTALGYAWQDYTSKTPGIDVIVEHTKTGTDYKGAARAKMAEMGVTKAYINCMWCGGFSGDITNTDNPVTVEQPAPVTITEVAENERAAEESSLADMDKRNTGRIGWCTKCHSYCFGDCEA